MTRKPELLIPIRDRRQHKRYLTLRNFGIATVVGIVAFAAISISSELRRPTHGTYGRLFAREVVQKPVEAKQIEVVTETPAIDDHVAADPFLVAPAARQQQWLGADAADLQPVVTTASTTPVVIAPVSGRQSDVAIVGGAEGVAVVQEERKRPVLRGGFGRPD